MRTNTNPDRVAVVEANLDAYLARARPAARPLEPGEPLHPARSPDPASPPGPAAGPTPSGPRGVGALTARRAVELFEDQLLSRRIDVAARELKKTGQCFYTISSAGHEQNGVLGTLLREDDPCFLHYRSGALMMARARRGAHLDPDADPVLDTLLGLTASADEPIAEGRHKVWGSRRLWVPPQTSTIGSHLPKAVGLAFALSRAKRMRVPLPVSPDAIVCCSFGDASSSHATALAALNAARYAFRLGNPTPILFVCEDNRIGISTATPDGWIRERFGTMANLAYYEAIGPLDDVWEQCSQAVRHCRNTRGPVFLRLDCVRLWGHAGSDVESSYRSWEEICEIEASDPVLANARRLVETGAATPAELIALRACGPPPSRPSRAPSSPPGSASWPRWRPTTRSPSGARRPRGSTPSCAASCSAPSSPRSPWPRLAGRSPRTSTAP